LSVGLWRCGGDDRAIVRAASSVPAAADYLLAFAPNPEHQSLPSPNSTSTWQPDVPPLRRSGFTSRVRASPNSPSSTCIGVSTWPH